MDNGGKSSENAHIEIKESHEMEEWSGQDLMLLKTNSLSSSLPLQNMQVYLERVLRSNSNCRMGFVKDESVIDL